MLLITGAGSGIGKFLVDHFGKLGPLAGTYRSSKIDDPRLSRVDIQNFAEVEKWRSSFSPDTLQKLVLINCAGINYNSFGHKADVNEWRKVIDTNLIGTFNVIRAFLPAMREQGYGRIINFGSVVSQKGVMGTSAYAASKSALHGLAKALAAENAAKGITVNTINLGYCDIGMGISQISPPQKAELVTRIPAGRFGTADEILSTVTFLINTEYCNGTDIDLSGGFV